ncbi:MAG TPA: Maf family protein, partial [Polyangiaceae bacterium]|nr:Maf family protein [Polyangiaceae bacterium]
IPLVVRATVVDEDERADESPEAYLDRVVRAKLDAVRALGLGAGATVLVADTIVVAPDGKVLHKPKDEDEACRAVERLAGATHDVMTRFVLADGDPALGPSHAETVATRVTFRALVPGEARAYARSGEGRDKAGGYAVQGRAASFVAQIAGSFTNVVGLPICQVVVAMRAVGWVPGAL